MGDAHRRPRDENAADLVERYAMKQDCPHCGALAGARCQLPSGKKVYPHEARANLLRAMYWEAFTQGRRDAMKTRVTGGSLMRADGTLYGNAS